MPTTDDVFGQWEEAREEARGDNNPDNSSSGGEINFIVRSSFWPQTQTSG
jgi:hypothetical protein